VWRKEVSKAKPERLSAPGSTHLDGLLCLLERECPRDDALDVQHAAGDEADGTRPRVAVTEEELERHLARRELHEAVEEASV
jgi:hypothetical protein